jgi:antitoxin component of MazEF toxin-antitoxin module
MYLLRKLRRIGTSDYFLVPKDLKEMVGIENDVKVSIENGKIILEKAEEAGDKNIAG